MYVSRVCVVLCCEHANIRFDTIVFYYYKKVFYQYCKIPLNMLIRLYYTLVLLLDECIFKIFLPISLSLNMRLAQNKAFG